MNARYVRVMDSSNAPDFDAMSGRLLAMIPAALGILLVIAVVFWLIATITERREKIAYFAEVARLDKESGGKLSEEQLHQRAMAKFFPGKNQTGNR